MWLPPLRNADVWPVHPSSHVPRQHLLWVHAPLQGSSQSLSGCPLCLTFFSPPPPNADVCLPDVLHRLTCTWGWSSCAALCCLTPSSSSRRLSTETRTMCGKEHTPILTPAGHAHSEQWLTPACGPALSGTAWTYSWTSSPSSGSSWSSSP